MSSGSTTGPIAGVMFDLGGTLFAHLPPSATEQSLRGALQLQSRRALTPSDLAVYHELRRLVEQQFAHRAFFFHRELVLTAAQRFCEHLASVGLDLARDHFAQAFYSLQRTAVIEQLQLREDTAHVLQTLRAWGLQVSIVSNIDEDYLGPLLAREPDLTACDFVLSSEYCRSCKPDQEIFRRALQRSGLLPEQLLFVGDSLTNDVEGAWRSGMRSAWLICDQPATRVAPFLEHRVQASHARPELIWAEPPQAPDLLLLDLAELLPLLRGHDRGDMAEPRGKRS